MIAPLCAYCARRLAECVDQVDGRMVNACIPCVDDFVPDQQWAADDHEPTVTRQVLLYLRHADGATFEDIRVALDVATARENPTAHRALWSAVQSLCGRGVVLHEPVARGWRQRWYRLARPMSYSQVVDATFRGRRHGASGGRWAA